MEEEWRARAYNVRENARLVGGTSVADIVYESQDNCFHIVIQTDPEEPLAAAAEMIRI